MDSCRAVGITTAKESHEGGTGTMAKDSGTELGKARDQNTWVAQERFLTRSSGAARHVSRNAYSLFVNKYQLGIHASFIRQS